LVWKGNRRITQEIIGINPKSMKSRINYGIKVQVGPVGEVLRVKDILNSNGTYKPNILSQIQLYVAKFIPEAGTTNIDESIHTQWAQNSDIKLDDIKAEHEIYCVGRGDSMAHVMKGNIGLFLSGVKNMRTHNLKISNIRNLGPCSKDEGQTIPFDGNVSRGIVIAACEDIVLKGELSDVYSKTSCSIGVDIMGKSKNITLCLPISGLDVESNNFPNPNRLSCIRAIQVSSNSYNIISENVDNLKK
jgi:hypothetical protein